MGYLALANWICFKKNGDDKYLVNDLLINEQFELCAYDAWFAHKLDGKTNPYTIDDRLTKDEIDELLHDLKEKNVIRDSRFLIKSIFALFVTVWKPHVTPALRLISTVINALLLIAWLPVLIFAIYCVHFHLQDLSGDYIVSGSIFGILAGIILHESGHMFACLAYGGGVFEVGVMLKHFLPGAYVLLNTRNIKSRMKNVQISAAGIEMNFLLAGVCMILGARFEFLSGFFIFAAICNVFLGLINLAFIDGMDGMAIMGELIGVTNLVYKAKDVTKSKSRRTQLIKRGISGKAVVVFCYLIRIVQIALPLIIMVNIAEVISCFL